MHWGLTRFERKRIERIALDHPFFDMHPQLFTRKELRAVLAQGPRKSGPQVIAEVRKELGMIYAPDCQNQRTFAEALRDATFVPSFRRTVVFSILSILLVLFLTMTVPGRTFAEEVYFIIIEYVNGSLNAHNNLPSENRVQPDFTTISEGLNTPQELSMYVDYPIYMTSDKLTAFDYEIITPEIMICVSQYETIDKKPYIIYQKLKGPNVSWGASIDAIESPAEIKITSDLKMYLSHSNDGDIYAIGFTDYYLIEIASPVLSSNELRSILRKIYIIE